MCLRVYAVTGGNKLLAGPLSVLVIAQVCFGIYFTILYGMIPREFGYLSRLCVVSYRPLVQPLPEINLDAYKTCLPPRWRPGEVANVSISVTFGTPLPSDIVSP